jgi:hypothetical protein
MHGQSERDSREFVAEPTGEPLFDNPPAVATPTGVEASEADTGPAPIGPAQLAALLTAVPDVWIARPRRGIEYHRPEPNDVTGCGRTTRYGEILPRSEVIDRFGSKPCGRCYPGGDDSVLLIGGRHPVVLVGQAHGEPALAEVRKARPGGRIVQVVYLDSRTGAWIKADRIVEPARAA